MGSKRNRNFILHEIIPQIIQLPWHAFSFSCLLGSPSSWMTDHAHTSNAISWVFTAQILSEFKLIWHILQTDLVFIQQTIAHEGHPKRLGRSFWSVLRGQIYLLLLWNVLEQALGPWQFFYFFSQLSAVNIFVFVWSDQWNSHWKKKNLNFILLLEFFFLSVPSKPTRKFHRPEKTVVVSSERSILYIVLYYRVEDMNPLPIKARSACLWLKLLKA